MRKFLTTGFLGAILGLLVGAPADASLISRSFLDQALTDYATNTALDLKANQSDFTDLNTQISDSVDVLRQLLEQGGYSYEFVNFLNPEKYPNTISGAFSLLYQYLDEFAGSILNGWTDSGGNYIFGLRDITEDYYNTTRPDIRKLFDGWDAGNNTSYLGVIGLNDKIGTLPEGITVQGMYEGWTLKDHYFHGLNVISGYASMVEDAYRVRFPFLFTQGSQSTTIDGVDYTGPVYPLWKLSEGVDKIDSIETIIGSIDNKIGTLPSGNFPSFPGSDLLFPWLNQPLTYPTSLAELINAIYGDEETRRIGLLPGIIARFPIDTDGDGDTDVYTGLIPNFRLATEAKELATTANTTATAAKTAADANTAKIGTLPSGSLLGNGPAMDVLFSFAQNTDTPVFPNSLSDLINQLYVSNERPGVISALIQGFEFEGVSDDVSVVGILPAMELGLSATQAAETAQETATAAKTVADANTAKIGTLPSGQIHMRLPGFSIFESAGIIAPFNYPTSLSDLFLYLFGSNEDTTKDGLFPVIGTWVRDISAQINSINITSNAIKSKIGTVPDGKNLAGMIGTLPDGYDSVGAALTAIKGIAEEAKAAAVAAIPDPKTEGSTGKFVLTVDIVGDNATYRWEKIDREGETTTTTE